MSASYLRRNWLAWARHWRRRKQPGPRPRLLSLRSGCSFTGCRTGEILTLRWEEVDLERRTVRLPDSKTGAKTIHLSAPAVEVLKSLSQAESPWVIRRTRGDGHLVNLRKPWHRIRAAAELRDVRLHDLRHTFASVGAGAGLGLPIICYLLGHSQPATTQRYAHLADDPLREATNLIGDWLAAALGAESAEDAEAVRH